jgi:hypothetical protein
VAEAAPDVGPLLVQVNDELGRHAFPVPDECVGDLSPEAALFYVEQWSYALLKLFAELGASSIEQGVEAPDQVAQTCDAIAAACGNLDAACVLMSVLPPQAVDK